MRIEGKRQKKTWLIVLTTILSMGAVLGITLGTLYATGVLGDKEDYTVREFVEELSIVTTGANGEYTTRLYSGTSRDDDHDDDYYYTYGTVTFNLDDAYVITRDGYLDVTSIKGDTDLESDPYTMQQMSSTGITYNTELVDKPTSTDEMMPLLTNFTMTFTDITYNGKVIDDSATVDTYVKQTEPLEYEYVFDIY